jgi:putative radical SAM enzyme (TIGR03279 family)
VVEYQLPKLRVAGSNPVARSIFDCKEMCMRALSNRSHPGRTGSRPSGVKVGKVAPDSPGAGAGLLPGDVITCVDGEPIVDFLDFYAAAFGQTYTLTVSRAGREHDLVLERRPGEDTGIEIETGTPILCNNRCVFCFFDQLPKGLRADLYVKDEDYRLSFLHGNYLTLTGLGPKEEARILAMHLSPLYVSVHSTDETARAKMLGRKPPEPILSIVDRLGKAGIRFHTQVVVVPGYNDKTLKSTLTDLCDRNDFVLSASVVPVGLTRHRKGLPEIRLVNADEAREMVHYVNGLNHRMRQRLGHGLVYASDELVIRSGSTIPPAPYYDDYPQFENGVGLVRVLLDSARQIQVRPSLQGKHFAFITGTLAAPYLREIADGLAEQGVNIDVVIIENNLLGSTVTVSGLLAGKDILNRLPDASSYDAVILPPNILNDNDVAIDDIGLSRMAEGFGAPVVVGDYDLTQTFERLDVVLSQEQAV